MILYDYNYKYHYNLLHSDNLAFNINVYYKSVRVLLITNDGIILCIIHQDAVIGDNLT